jgi:glutaredoxin 3
MGPVRIYTTEYCAYCVLAKRLLGTKKVPFEEIDVTGDAEARDRLVRMSGGRHTVPQIWIGDFHVGGYTELAALDRAGELDRLLRSG